MGEGMSPVGFVSSFLPSTRGRASGGRATVLSVSTRRSKRVESGFGRARRTPATCVWVERSASVDVEASAEELFIYYSDLETLPKWSPWVKDVSLDPNDPLLSEWTLGARGFTFKWNTRITAADRAKRIAWRSENGLDNEGYVTFTPRNGTTAVKLVVRFNVPGIAAALFSTAFIGRFVDGTLAQDLERFRNVSLRNVRERVAEGKPAPTHAAPLVEHAMAVLGQKKDPTSSGDR